MARKSKHNVNRSDNRTNKSRKQTLEAQGPAPLDSSKLKELYSTMLKCRMIAEKARLLVKQGNLSGDLFSTTGQEATEVGALIDLLAEDCIAPGRRDCTASFIRGMPLKLIFAQLYARQAGRVDGFSSVLLRRHGQLSMIAPSFSLSAQLNIATGAAWAARRHGKPNVAVTFSGDDSVSLGFWRDALNFSVAHKLPVVHVVHNNAGEGSISARVSLPGTDSATSSQRASLPTFTVDGNDVVAVYRVAQEAIRRARQGYGPALIECQTYRWCSQLETDSAKNLPSAVELEHSADPLSLMEAYLKQERLWSDRWKRKLMESVAKELDKAVEFAERSLQPPEKVAHITPSPLATAS
jgi:acetoin:2,6-dichlorophenolindophenol oxidoreductase subunit alpha